jgi:hypothetical protein
MAIQYINTGSSANAGDGDSLRSAFVKVNNNFAYLSTATVGTGGNGYTGSHGYTGSAGIGYTGSSGIQGYTGSSGFPNFVLNTSSRVGSIAQYTAPNYISPASRLEYLAGTLYLGNKTPGANNQLYMEQQVYTDAFGRGFTYAQHHETVDSMNFSFYRSRGTAITPTAVQERDELGEIVFWGHDGTTATAGLFLTAVVDQTPSTGIMPTRFRFAGNTGTGGIVGLAEITSTGTLRVNRISALNSNLDHAMLVDDSLVPSTNDLNLGSTSSQWHSLYVSSSTIYLGGVPLGISNNQLTVNGAPIQTSSLVRVSNTPPNNASTGTLWYDDVSGRTYIYYDDSWIDTNPTVIGYTGSAGTNGYTGSAGTNGYTGSVGYTGSAGAGIQSTSTLVNGTWTVSLSIDGTFKSPLRNDDTVTATNFIVNYNPVTKELTTSLNYTSSFNTNTLVASAINATTATTAGRLGNLRVVSAPSLLTGTSTNALGDIAFDSTYFYYCSGTYTSATNNILLSQQENFTNPNATIHFTKGAVTPQIGWILYASFSTWTITGVVDNGYPTNTWSVDITGLGSGSYSFSTGTVFAMTNPNPGAIWQRTPWNAITGAGTAARATTATYASIVLTEPTPASSTSTGVKGQIAVTSTSMYVCVATNSWLRFSGVTF